MAKKDVCPRCTGTLLYEPDIFSPEVVCLNCGFRKSIDQWKFEQRMKAAEQRPRVPAAA